MPYGSKKKPASVAAGIAGGSKKAENNRVASSFAALATVCAPALGQAFATANNAVMASGAAHDSGSPNSSAGGFDASQTSGHVADSNARRFPFNTSCDRASPTLAMPVSSPSAASQNVANRGARGLRRDTAAAAAQVVTQQSMLARQVAAFNTGCGAATVASLGTTAGFSSMETFADAQNASPSCGLWSASTHLAASTSSISGAGGSGSLALIGMQNVVALPVRIDAASGAVGSSTVEAVLPSELLSGAGRRRPRQDLQLEQEAEETEESKRARLFGRTALDAEDYLRHAESVAGLIISIDASYWSFMDDGSVVVPDSSRYRGKVCMHILCYDLALSIFYLTKGYSMRPWTVGTPPSYTVPLIYISTPLLESVVSLIEC
jgi:hypothetical protein